MIHALARNWWALVIRGIAAILFGIAAFVLPGATLLVLVILFGAYAMVDGIFAFVAAVRAAESHERWLSLIVEGVVGVTIGLVTIVYPAITALALVYLIAFWAIATGIVELWVAVELRRLVASEIWLILAGLLSLAFGVIIALRPEGGALAVVWLIGWYALLFGVLMVVLGLRLRRHIGPST